MNSNDRDKPARTEVMVATRNRGKLREIREILEGSGVRLLSLDDYPDLPEVVEDGDTLAENALKKARSICEWTGKVAIADDTGLEVDALDGRPGVHSARYAGERAGDDERRAKLLAELDGVPVEGRGAAFRCVMAIAMPDGREELVEGECRGRICEEPKGANGFGYDPLFLVPEYGMTFAEIAPEVKNRISHRGRALAGLMKVLPDYL